MIYGALIDWISHEYHTNLLEGIQRFIHEKDIKLFIFEGGIINSPRKFENQRNTIFDLATSSRLDGLIISTGSIAHRSTQEQLLKYLERFKNIPYVSVAREVAGVPSIIIDNEKGIKDLTRHLIEQHDCRSFAFIQGPSENQESQLRFKAFKSVLDDSGIGFDLQLTWSNTFWASSGSDAVKFFLSQNKKIDAIICANDDLALGAMEELSNLGIKVPDDILVTGFDNSRASQICIPSLSTVHQPAHKLGYESAAALHRLIQGDKEPSVVKIPTEIIIRESCGCELKSNPFMRIHYDLNIANHTPEEYKPFQYVDEFEKKLLFLKDNYLSINFQDLGKLFSQYLQGNNKLFLSYFVQRLEELREECSEVEPKIIITNWIANLWKEYAEGILLQNQADDIKRWNDNFHLSSLRDHLLLMSSIQQSVDEMANHIENLQIRTCYALLYEDFSAVSCQSRLIFAYENKNISIHEKHRKCIDARLILPDKFFKDLKDQIYLVFALHHSEFSFGYMIMDYQNGKEIMYEELRRIISRNLRSAILFEEIQKANNELKLSEANLRSLTEATPLPLLLMEPDIEKIIYANKPFYELFNIQPKQALGANLVNLPFIFRIYQQLQKMESGENFESLISIGSKNKFIVSSYQMLVFRGVKTILLSFFDITERRELEKAVLEISNREQRRIGQELHDDICQDLTGISAYSKALGFLLEKIELHDQAQKSYYISSLVNKTISKTQDLARGLFPPELGEKGLISSLNELAKQIQNMHQINTHFSYHNEENIKESSLWLNLMRIAQEGINNAVRHGKAKNIWIYFHSSAQKVLLHIQDDGKGLPEHLNSPGMGIRTMKYRAEMMGAEIIIRNRLQGGVELLCELKQNSRI